MRITDDSGSNHSSCYLSQWDIKFVFKLTMLGWVRLNGQETLLREVFAPNSHAERIVSEPNLLHFPCCLQACRWMNKFWLVTSSLLGRATTNQQSISRLHLAPTELFCALDLLHGFSNIWPLQAGSILPTHLLPWAWHIWDLCKSQWHFLGLRHSGTSIRSWFTMCQRCS